jgi:hypothetical protein
MMTTTINNQPKEYLVITLIKVLCEENHKPEGHKGN